AAGRSAGGKGRLMPGREPAAVGAQQVGEALEDRQRALAELLAKLGVGQHLRAGKKTLTGPGPVLVQVCDDPARRRPVRVRHLSSHTSCMRPQLYSELCATRFFTWGHWVKYSLRQPSMGRATSDSSCFWICQTSFWRCARPTACACCRT